MTTVNDILEESLRLLLGSQTEVENELLTSIDETATNLSFAHELGALSAGSTISVGLESMRVWSVDSNSNSAVVRRGYRGTTPVAHTTDELVVVNPKYSKASLAKALEQEVYDLSSPANGLYRMGTFDLTYAPVTVGYDVPTIADFIDIYRLHQRLIGPGDAWMALTDWVLERNQSNTSGLRLTVRRGEPGQQIRVSYKHGFAWPSDIGINDDIETETGIPASMHDILSLGVLMRVGPSKEIQRNQPEAQGSSRRSEEVPPGSITRSYTVISAQRQSRIRAEALRLSRIYPDFSS